MLPARQSPASRPPPGRRAILLILLAGLGFPYPAFGTQAKSVFPGLRWEEAAPETQGVDEKRLLEAVTALEQGVGNDGVRELVIIRHGRIIWKGPEIDKVHPTWSFTKSFTSTVLGLLSDDGKAELDTMVRDVVPELGEFYPDIRLRHFATMTSGYRARGDDTLRSYQHGPSRTPLRPGQPLFTPPGSQFAYWDSAMNQFGHVLTRLAGESLGELFKRRIADPIGMDPSGWRWGEIGTVEGVALNCGSGNMGKSIQISAREAARFGMLYLHRGKWGNKVLLSESWVEAATRMQVPAALPWAHEQSGIDGRGCYGLNWWVNGTKADGTRKLPLAPFDTFWAAGHNNNMCFVIPSWDMVIVRLGLDGDAGDEVWNHFLGKVGEALTPQPQQAR